MLNECLCNFSRLFFLVSFWCCGPADVGARPSNDSAFSSPPRQHPPHPTKTTMRIWTLQFWLRLLSNMPLLVYQSVSSNRRFSANRTSCPDRVGYHDVDLTSFWMWQRGFIEANCNTYIRRTHYSAELYRRTVNDQLSQYKFKYWIQYLNQRTSIRRVRGPCWPTGVWQTNIILES